MLFRSASVHPQSPSALLAALLLASQGRLRSGSVRPVPVSLLRLWNFGEGSSPDWPYWGPCAPGTHQLGLGQRVQAVWSSPTLRGVSDEQMPGQGLLYRQEVWVGCHYRVAFGGSAGNTCDTYVSSQNALLSQALASVCSSFLSVRSFGSRSLGRCLPWPLTAADTCLSLSMRRGRRGPGGTGERHGRVPGEIGRAHV